MGTLNQRATDRPVKMLLIGDTGTGKTGALASLVVAGYNVRILDFDNGLDSLIDALNKMGRADLMKNVYAETLTDAMKPLGAKIVPKGIPTAFQRGLELLDHWKVKGEGDAGYDLGKVENWTTKDILVIDSLSGISNAAFHRVLSLNKRSGEQPYQSDWGDGQRSIEGLLELLYSDSIKCNVIIIAHVAYIGDKDEDDRGVVTEKNVKGYPNTLGRALSPKVGRYFNYCLISMVTGTGVGTRRVISTVPDGVTQAKAPQGLKAQLPIETGLADFFKAVNSTTTQGA